MAIKNYQFFIYVERISFAIELFVWFDFLITIPKASFLFENSTEILFFMAQSTRSLLIPKTNSLFSDSVFHAFFLIQYHRKINPNTKRTIDPITPYKIQSNSSFVKFNIWNHLVRNPRRKNMKIPILDVTGSRSKPDRDKKTADPSKEQNFFAISIPLA